MNGDITRQDWKTYNLAWFCVGVERFELSTSSSRTKRANRAALHPAWKQSKLQQKNSFSELKIQTVKNHF